MCRFIMMKRPAIFLFSIFAFQSLNAALPQRSVSPSQQFIIYGADVTLRGTVSELGEQTKTNLLALLRQHDRWKTPIVVNLQPQQANLPEIPPAELLFSQTGVGLKLQLDLTITQNLDASLMERELLRAILLEMIYRKKRDVSAGTIFVEPPDWLLDGVLACTPGRDREPLVEALSLSDNKMSLVEFLGQRPELLDSAGRMLYRAYSFALVRLLVDGPDGSSRLARYIENLSNASIDPLASLQAQFPFLSGDVEKIWRSNVERLDLAQSDDLLTFAESERRLDELLSLKISEPNKPLKLVRLEELAQHKLSASEKMALNQLKRDLMSFVPQTNPVLRPIGREYQEIVALLARGKRQPVLKRLSRLNLTRQQLATRMTEVDDYMNWFEATQMGSCSGNFAGYLKAVDQSQGPAPRRHDPLSVYVDALEDQFEN